jgi:hypothetical protein
VASTTKVKPGAAAAAARAAAAAAAAAATAAQEPLPQEGITSYVPDVEEVTPVPAARVTDPAASTPHREGKIPKIRLIRSSGKMSSAISGSMMTASRMESEVTDSEEAISIGGNDLAEMEEEDVGAFSSG